ncbi:cellulase family glycosylhydrolase [Williamsia sterculiae]|nr:cellulase family glycosylhydrolase [Williamsia sterculiae]
MSRTRLIAVLFTAVASALCFATPAGAAPAAPAAGYGFTEGSGMLDLSPGALNRELDAVSRTTATRLRVLVDWSQVEPTRGTFNWSAPDRVINAARAHGLTVLADIAFTPTWAGGGIGPGKTAPPTRAGDFGAFAATVAQRYQSRVNEYEIWNEPNLAFFFGGVANKPQRFAALLRAAYPAIKRVQPNSTIVSGGLSRSVGVDSPPSFLAAVYAAGGGGSFDAVGMHPYVFPGGLRSNPENAWSDVRRVHDLMAAHGDGGKKIWLTEFGAPTNNPLLGGVSPQQQATQIVDVLAAAARTPYVGPAYVYSIRDLANDPTAQVNRELQFGALLTFDFRPKPGAGLLAR